MKQLYLGRTESSNYVERFIAIEFTVEVAW